MPAIKKRISSCCSRWRCTVPKTAQVLEPVDEITEWNANFGRPNASAVMPIKRKITIPFCSAQSVVTSLTELFQCHEKKKYGKLKKSEKLNQMCVAAFRVFLFHLGPPSTCPMCCHSYVCFDINIIIIISTLLWSDSAEFLFYFILKKWFSPTFERPSNQSLTV